MARVNDLVARAFHEGRPAGAQNTTVTLHRVNGIQITSLYLHGSEVARRAGSFIAVNLQGYPTKTTMSRLQALVTPHARIWQESGRIYWISRDSVEPQVLPVKGWTMVLRGSVLEQMANITLEEVLCADR